MRDSDITSGDIIMTILGIVIFCSIAACNDYYKNNYHGEEKVLIERDINKIEYVRPINGDSPHFNLLIKNNDGDFHSINIECFRTILFENSEKNILKEQSLMIHTIKDKDTIKSVYYPDRYAKNHEIHLESLKMIDTVNYGKN